jgi:hypothetical protein
LDLDGINPDLRLPGDSGGYSALIDVPCWGVDNVYKVAGHHGVGVSRAAFLYDESTVILCVVEARST